MRLCSRSRSRSRFYKDVSTKITGIRGEKSTGTQRHGTRFPGDTKSALMKPISSFLTTRRTSPPVIGARVKCQPQTALDSHGWRRVQVLR